MENLIKIGFGVLMDLKNLRFNLSDGETQKRLEPDDESEKSELRTLQWRNF